MNREIKFIFWDIFHMKMIYPKDIWEIGNLFATIDDRELEPLQYTGLKDKNGKEIFEGYIVKYKAEYGSSDVVGEFEEETEKVEYSDGSFFPIPINRECGDSWYDIKYYDFEVVGNIYENPELLNNK